MTTEAQATQPGAGVQANEPPVMEGSEHDIVRRLAAIVDQGEDGSHSADDGADAADDGRGDDRREPQSTAANPDQQAAAQQQADDDPLFTVKIDGTERQVKRSELIASYQKDAASSKRFEEVAAQRREVDQQRQSVATERQQLVQALNYYVAQLQAVQQQAQPNWDDLLRNDPAEYLRQRHSFEQRQQQLSQAQAAQAYLAQQQRGEWTKQAQADMAQQQQRMLDAIPEWRDEAKLAEGRKELRAALSKAGFSDEEINGISDHRAVVMARKAMLYDQMIAAQKDAAQQANEKLQKLPAVRVAQPGSGETNPTDGRRAAMQRLTRTGRVEDAAAVISQLLG